MIGMDMGDEKIRSFQIDVQFMQGTPHGPKAFLTVHPRIDHQKAVFAADQVRVDRLQGIARQGDFGPEDVGKNLFSHGFSFSLDKKSPGPILDGLTEESVGAPMAPGNKFIFSLAYIFHGC